MKEFVKNRANLIQKRADLWYNILELVKGKILWILS